MNTSLAFWRATVSTAVLAQAVLTAEYPSHYLHPVILPHNPIFMSFCKRLALQPETPIPDVEPSASRIQLPANN